MAIIRLREFLPHGEKDPIKRYEFAYAWDNDQPGRLLWNNAEADRITDIGESIELAISTLERKYDQWVNNLSKEKM